MNDDELWRQILRGLNKEFYHQTVKAEQIERYIIEKTGLDLQPFFDQYLRDTRIPTFEYAIIGNKLRYRWANCVNDFNMKLRVTINGQLYWLQPDKKWQNLELENPIAEIEIDRDFYVASFRLTEITK
jgi:hypothetical protein